MSATIVKLKCERDYMEAEKERYRTVQLNIRLTKNERAYIEDKANSVKMSVSSYARKIMMDGAIIYRDTSIFSKCMKELNAIGVNINQIAHNTNSVNNVIENDVVQLKRQYERLKALYVKLLGEFT